jgi:hypothetical protein
MDDRTFLPQVMRVLDKAYGPSGVLQSFQHFKAEAMATQYWGASWMAFSHGARWTALSLVWRAWRLQWGERFLVKRPWIGKTLRYLLGRYEHSGPAHE